MQISVNADFWNCLSARYRGNTVWTWNQILKIIIITIQDFTSCLLLDFENIFHCPSETLTVTTVTSTASNYSTHNTTPMAYQYTTVYKDSQCTHPTWSMCSVFRTSHYQALYLVIVPSGLILFLVSGFFALCLVQFMLCVHHLTFADSLTLFLSRILDLPASLLNKAFLPASAYVSAAWHQ